jgi:hypothetical protein
MTGWIRESLRPHLSPGRRAIAGSVAALSQLLRISLRISIQAPSGLATILLENQWHLNEFTIDIMIL